jgi:hypothetical protein
MVAMALVITVVSSQLAQAAQPVYCVLEVGTPEVSIDTMIIWVRNTGTGVAHGVILWASYLVGIPTLYSGGMRLIPASHEDVRATIPRLESGRWEKIAFPAPFEGNPAGGKLRKESYRATSQACQPE